MVGEDDISVRNRRSANGTAEEDNASSRLEREWSSSKSSNGCVDADHMITRKMQLLTEAEHLKPAFMKGIDRHFREFVDGLVSNSALLESSPSAFPTTCSEKDSSKTKDLRTPPARGKVFVVRRALLDELFEVNHFRSIFHIFVGFLILYMLNTLVIDYIDEGRLVLEFDLLVFAFGKLSVVVPTWLYMKLSTLAVPYGLFCLWAQGYHHSSHKTVRSLFFGMLLLLFQTVVLGIVPTYVALTYNLPPASGAIVSAEQIRMMMKIHSFIRENVPRITSSSPQKTNSVQLPRVSQYLYFLFAPTMIYRDEYPRTPTRRWSYVAYTFAQLLGTLAYLNYIFTRICIPTYRNYSREPFSLRGLVVCIFNSILPGIVILILFFFSMMHCWFNAFAEMLRFGDRMFYMDWWNSTSFANYFRTWNVVIHDWLYYYVYRDFLWLFGKKFRAAAMLLVFTLSAVVHEYIAGVSFGYFYPVMFTLFMCFGMLFNFILHDQRKSAIWNVVMWTSLLLGQGIMLSLYSHEWYARRHCPLKNPTFLDSLTPRSWTCYNKI